MNIEINDNFTIGQKVWVKIIGMSATICGDLVPPSFYLATSKILKIKLSNDQERPLIYIINGEYGEKEVGEDMLFSNYEDAYKWATEAFEERKANFILRRKEEIKIKIKSLESEIQDLKLQLDNYVPTIIEEEE